MKRIHLSYLLVSLAVTSACADSSEPREELDTVGVCFSGPGSQSTDTIHFEPGAELRATATVCTGCSAENEALSCTIEQSDDVLTIHTLHTYDQVDPAFGSECPAICHNLEAVCDSPPLDEGSYIVMYKGQRTSLTVPSDADLACMF